MAASVVGGPLKWEGAQDDEGHRTYQITYRVRTLPTEGPAVVLYFLNTLIPPGTPWNIDADTDLWAYRLPGTQVKMQREGEPNRLWLVDLRFSTKPPEKPRCNTTPIEDPLLEPQKVSGTFITKTEEGVKDRFGQSITNSSHEPITGPQNEWDADGGDTVVVEQNVADLELDVMAALKNQLNDAPLWGMPARHVKFSRYSWSKEFYGTCFHYYKRRLEFDVNAAGFDRDILDEGTKVLHGYWDSTSDAWIVDVLYDSGEMPDSNNPSHFDRATDRQGNPIHVVLDGQGKPFVPVAAITTCTQCPTGAPANWDVSGTRNTDDIITIPNTTDCTWAGSNVTLTYDSGDDEWILTDTATPGTEWTLDASAWNCMGPNTLTRTTGTGGQAFATVVNADQPGTRRIEKYKSGNLLALDIPTTI